MKRFLTVSILVFLAVFVSNAYAPDEQKFKVYVDVTTEKEDETEKQIIESHLKRDLRVLGDVQIVDEKDDWEFRILVTALGHETPDGRETNNISIAVSVQRRVPKFYFKTQVFDNSDFILPVFAGGPDLANWHKDDLPTWSVSTVDELNEDHLKIHRKYR